MKLSKIILLIVIIFEFSIPIEFWHFVAHLPNLIEHFDQHTKEKVNESLLDFIAEHISNFNHYQHEKHNPDDLPFHCHHSSDCNHNLNFVSIISKGNFKTFIFVISSEKVINKQFFHISEFYQKIWNPPKLS